MNNYRVIKENGVFKAQEEQRFLFWTYWSTLQEAVSPNMDGLSSVDFSDLIFATAERAEDYIDLYHHSNQDVEVVKHITLP